MNPELSNDRTTPKPITSVSGQPLVTIGDLRVHFDLGAKRELPPQRRSAYRIISFIVAAILSRMVVRGAISVQVYPINIWARIAFVVILYVFVLIIVSWFALVIL